jgi:hypothetical protein
MEWVRIKKESRKKQWKKEGMSALLSDKVC